VYLLKILSGPSCLLAALGASLSSRAQRHEEKMFEKKFIVAFVG
jgi:hypothetical protein